ncbi:hypothetical protein [Stappia indica]|uniref:hypothetical protein n=1 Tax=Stappia indica TaxID=538381 RepID=UPI0011477138|nr:hypothetical protein [Stappia indica]
MAAREIAQLLRSIADLIENDDPEQANLLRQVFESSSKNYRQSKSSRVKYSPRLDFSEISSRLARANSRQEGREILKEMKLTKVDLSRLGREFNIHITKSDGSEVVEDKIIEALIGGRLNSKAIRGEE